MNSSFHSKEFASCMFDPTKVPEGTDILKFFKELGKHKEFKLDAGAGIDNNKLMLYIICMYDKNSPYRKKYNNDLIRRRIEAAHDCGFKVNEQGEFDSPVKNFLEGKNKVVNRKIVAYCRLHRNFKYSYLVMIETSYYNLMGKIMEGDIAKRQEVKNIQQDLEDTASEILNQDNSIELRDELLRFMEEDRVMLRPEDIARKLQNDEQPLPA